MPQVQYPFIDIAVHPAVRARFAAGEAIVLFSPDMADVLWANGAGAKLFGRQVIYDLLDNGPDRNGVSYRQLAAASAQLSGLGDRRSFLMRIASNFSSTAMPAEVSRIEIRPGEEVVVFSAATAGLSESRRLGSMLEGFDDPDTHMAVIDGDGRVVAASPGFAAIGVSPETALLLINAVRRDPNGLIKRPIPSAAGYLPAAIGKVSDAPPLHLLFCVETVLGRMDPPEDKAVAAVSLGDGAFDTGPAVVADQDSSAVLAEPEATAPEAAEAEAEAAPEDFIEAGHPADDALPTELDGFDGQDHFAAAGLDADRDIDTADETHADQDSSAVLAEPDASETLPAITEPLPVNLDLAADEAFEAGAEAAPEDFVEAGHPVDDAIPAEVEEFADRDQIVATDVADDLGDAALEASADQDEPVVPAEAESTDTAAVADEPLPVNLTLAADEAEEAVSDAEPEEFLEAGQSAEEPESAAAAEDLADLARMDGASDQDLVEFGEADDASTVEDGSVSSTSEVTIPEPQFDVVEGEDEPEPVGDHEARAWIGATDGEAHSDVETQDTGMEIAGGETPNTTASEAGESAEDHLPVSIGHFTFHRDSRPVRFVWKLDAQGRFAEVSDEFRSTVGPVAGAINGQSFLDLASRYHLDPDGEIAGLLERRDTWSGRTIRWPVEGTELVVPVDLAALPTYSRNREFDGFRGFGIIRVADAENDPLGLGTRIAAGLPLEAPSAQIDDTVSESSAMEVTEADEDEAITLTVDGTFEDGKPGPDGSEAVEHDEFQGEVPALDIVSNPLASFSDKIIQLGDRRPKMRDGLSQTEQAAFREIGRQLEPFGKRPNELLGGDVDGSEVDAGEDDGTEAQEAQPAVAEAALTMDTPAAIDVPVAEDRSTEAENPDRAEDLVPAPEPPVADEIQSDFETFGEGPGLTANAIDQIPMAILIHAGDRLIRANGEFRRLTGYETLDALEAAGGLDSLITRKDGAEAGVHMVRSDGVSVPVSARLQSVRYEGASALMLALTPAAKAETPVAAETASEAPEAMKIAALKVEVDELRSILETATDGVVLLGTDGRIRSMNRSASALFNFDSAELVGKPFAMLFAHESQKAVQDYLSGLSGHGVASVLNDGREVIGREASGGFIPLFMTLGRMPGSMSYCAVIRDITQWKRSEEELRSAKRAAETANQHKSDFLARVSHEIRTPLNAIIGFSDMIATEHFGPAGHPRYVEYANDIGRSGRHVLDIVNDLLDISKIEAGEMDLDFTAVALNDCISEAVSLVQPQANGQRVIIRTSLSQSVPDVVADLRSIKQIAINIIANAIKFTPSGGQIVVSTAYEPAGSVTLRIRDTGIGMSRSELEQAMKPFGQVSPGTRQRGEGTGLGLPLTKAMTEANRANFSIHSAPNEGTLVEISFPPQRVLAD